MRLHLKHSSPTSFDLWWPYCPILFTIFWSELRCVPKYLPQLPDCWKRTILWAQWRLRVRKVSLHQQGLLNHRNNFIRIPLRVDRWASLFFHPPLRLPQISIELTLKISELFSLRLVCNVFNFVVHESIDSPFELVPLICCDKFEYTFFPGSYTLPHTHFHATTIVVVVRVL